MQFKSIPYLIKNRGQLTRKTQPAEPHPLAAQAVHVDGLFAQLGDAFSYQGKKGEKALEAKQFVLVPKGPVHAGASLVYEAIDAGDAHHLVDGKLPDGVKVEKFDAKLHHDEDSGPYDQLGSARLMRWLGIPMSSAVVKDVPLLRVDPAGKPTGKVEWVKATIVPKDKHVSDATPTLSEVKTRSLTSMQLGHLLFGHWLTHLLMTTDAGPYNFKIVQLPEDGSGTPRFALSRHDQDSGQFGRAFNDPEGVVNLRENEHGQSTKFLESPQAWRDAYVRYIRGLPGGDGLPLHVLDEIGGHVVKPKSGETVSDRLARLDEKRLRRFYREYLAAMPEQAEGVLQRILVNKDRMAPEFAAWRKNVEAMKAAYDEHKLPRSAYAFYTEDHRFNLRDGLRYKVKRDLLRIGRQPSTRLQQLGKRQRFLEQKSAIIPADVSALPKSARKKLGL